MEKLGRKKIAGQFRKDMNTLANELEDECKDCPVSTRITATSTRWKSESEHNYAGSQFIAWQNNMYNVAPICCEWGIISFNPQETTTEQAPEGTIDLFHHGIFTKTSTTLANEAFEVVKDSTSNKKIAKEERDLYATQLHYKGCGGILLLQPRKGVLRSRMLLWRRLFRLQQNKVMQKRKP